MALSIPDQISSQPAAFLPFNVLWPRVSSAAPIVFSPQDPPPLCLTEWPDSKDRQNVSPPAEHDILIAEEDSILAVDGSRGILGC